MQGTFIRARWGVLAMTAVLLLVSGGWQGQTQPLADGNVYQQARLFENVLSMIHRQYIDSVGEGELYRAAATALVKSLGDPYAELLTGESYRQHRLQMAGDELGALPPGLGDRLVTRRVSPTTVHVSAASPGVMLGHGIGYVALHRMSEGAADELRAEIDRLVGQGMKRLVLDLRLNPGGLIAEGIRVADLFLAAGDTVATSVGRTPERSKVYVTQEAKRWRDLPLAVLINRGTASSAELIAGALQDHDRAVIVGTSTYGKGVLQTTYPLGEDAAIKLTTARWYTPSGRSVQRRLPDSLASTLRRDIDPNRMYRTKMGRPMPQGRGIVPDLLVRSTARSETERAFLAELGSDVVVFRSELAAYAGELARTNGTRLDGFEVTRKARDELFERLLAQGLDVPREAYNAAGAYVDDQLDYEVTRPARGPGAEARRRTRSDRQLQAALTVLRQADTQEQALAIAALTRRAAR